VGESNDDSASYTSNHKYRKLDASSRKKGLPQNVPTQFEVVV